MGDDGRVTFTVYCKEDGREKRLVSGNESDVIIAVVREHATYYNISLDQYRIHEEEVEWTDFSFSDFVLLYEGT